MTEIRDETKGSTLNRREFLKSSAVGLGIAAAGGTLGRAAPSVRSGQMTTDGLNIAIIGCGAQGRVLVESILRIPEIRVRAICDIWEYSQTYTANYLKKYNQEVNVYEDYRELLDAEKDLDAAIVATPDWVHAEHANACLNAGLNVYCEKEMSNSLAKARSMVQTAARAGKRLQIGHQRRSNPRYLHALNRLIKDRGILGRVSQAYAQWNRAKSDLLGWPQRYTISQAKLEQYGYASMTHFRNWRWYKKYGGGPIVDLGSHQIDLFSWLFGTHPATVVASGGNDYYENLEWYDNVMAIYEYETDEGTARALYQVQTTTKYGGFYEVFMGDNGSIQISEVPQRGNWAIREAHAPEWDSLVKEGLLITQSTPIQKVDTKNIFLDVRVTAEAGRWPLPIELAKPPHQPHLENFFNAVRRGTPLNCPAEAGYETAVAVISVNEAVDSKKLIRFRPDQFQA